MYRYFALYLIFINIIAFCAYGIDKKRAVRNQWRISEKALLGLGCSGRQHRSVVGNEGVSSIKQEKQNSLWVCR